MERTESKSETLNRLFKENGLLKEDWFEHSQYRIITRSGIEKIQYKNNVTVEFEAVTMSPAFCVVKASAIKRMDANRHLQVQTFGSAGFNADGNFPKNKGNQYLYFPELAEKRALSRAVLKACGFYELGVFGEDEADDFKQDKAQPNSKKQSPAIDEAVANYIPAPLLATPHQRTQILLLLNNSVIKQEEKDKMVSVLSTYDTVKADGAIAKLKQLIKERGGDPLAKAA